VLLRCRAKAHSNPQPFVFENYQWIEHQSIDEVLVRVVATIDDEGFGQWKGKVPHSGDSTLKCLAKAKNPSPKNLEQHLQRGTDTNLAVFKKLNKNIKNKGEVSDKKNTSGVKVEDKGPAKPAIAKDRGTEKPNDPSGLKPQPSAQLGDKGSK
jgi:hypothetical protein